MIFKPEAEEMIRTKCNTTDSSADEMRAAKQMMNFVNMINQVVIFCIGYFELYGKCAML